MSRRANPVLIGGFVVGAVVLLVTGIMAFGSGAIFRSTTTYVMYFGGDLSGLRVGAPVTFRGVPLGSVTAIRASLQRRFDRVETRIAVYAELEEGAIDIGADMPKPGADTEGYRLLIENGLRAQLQMQSLVTGQLFVQLDFHPDQPPIFVGGDPSVLEIPTIPTPLEMVTQSARKVLERLGELPLEEIVENLNLSLQGAGKLLNSPDTQAAMANLNGAVQDLRRVIAHMGTRFDKVADRLDTTLDSATRAMDEARGSLGALSEDSDLRYQLTNLLREATEAARSLRVLANTLERNPESLLSGKGGGGGE
jgi:paraquat-inducible protein B